MSLQAEMHSLVGQIAVASNTRRAGLLSLQRQVGGLREELHLAHGTMAHELRAGLGKARLGLGQEEARRRSRVQGWIGEIASDRGAAQTEWRNMAATPREKRVPGDKPLSSGQGQEGTHRRRQGGKA